MPTAILIVASTRAHADTQEILRIQDKKGSLVCGKDADLVIWSHHPFDIHARAESVFIEGKKLC